MKKKDYSKEKIKDNRGFSLLEMLLVIFMISILTTMMARIIPTAVEAYTGEVDASNAQVLLSTTINELKDELGTATDLRIDTTDSTTVKTVTYKSGNTGYDASITSESDGIYITNYKGTSMEERRLLVSSAAATKNLHAEYESVEYNSTTGVVTINCLKVVKKTKGNTVNTVADLVLKGENEYGVLLIRSEKK